MKCVYKISSVNDDIKEIYIGSTKDLERRIIEHKSRYNNNYNWKVYNFIRENGGLKTWDIYPVEIIDFPISTEELKQYEQAYMDKYKPELNTQYCIRPKNYRDKYKDYFREKNNKRVKCKYCDKELNNSSLKGHIKRKHPTLL